MTEFSKAIKALELPYGARFYRCALQVNPFSYVKRLRKPTSLSDEDAYNQAIIAACREHNVEVVAVQSIRDGISRRHRLVHSEQR